MSRKREFEKTSISENDESKKKFKADWKARIRDNEYAFFTVFTKKDLFFLKLITIFQNGTKWDNYKSGDQAVKHGYLSLLELKKKCGEKLLFSSKVIILAASNGYLEILKWIKENTPLNSRYCIMNEDIRQEKLKTWEMNPCDLGWRILETDAMDKAAENGHLEVVKWLYANGEYCSKQAIYLATMNGHLETVKWLHDNNDKCCIEIIYR